MSSSEAQKTPTSDLSLTFKSKKPVTPKRQVVDNGDPLSSKTPEKPQQLRHQKKTHACASEKLPLKYEILGEFFDGLTGSIRLLRLRSFKPSFTNLCRQIECLTERRFTYSHLAQLKFILPEVIEIKKVLVKDERTSCMKPDLHVTMNFNAVENDGKLKSEGCGIMQMRRAFRTRLADFLRSHPEDDEIPEEALPHPFNHEKQDMHSDSDRIKSSPGGVLTDVHAVEQPAASTTCLQGDEILDEIHPVPSNQSEEDLDSNINIICNPSFPIKTSFEAPKMQQPEIQAHLPRSFQRFFSLKVTRSESENIQEQPPRLSVQDPNLSVLELNLNAVCSIGGTSTAAAASLYGQVPATPAKVIDPIENDDGLPRKIASIKSTPAKHASTPARLMANTPELHPPNRCYMSPDDSSTSSPNKLVRHPPCSRSLKFDTTVRNIKVEDEILDLDGASTDNDNLNILSWDPLLKDKVRNAIAERNSAISQAKTRQQMIASLPKLFNMIHFLIHSMNHFVIPKEELLDKLVSSNHDIVDRRDVEEQLYLLLELVPEWISEKELASGGDLLYIYINKMSNPQSVRARLEEAK